ncbi:uncharacterized protein AB9X84_019121 isoform 1-T2 [Acanthopagrus schlegelii]
MYRENEDRVMSAPGVRSDGSSCRHMFAPLVRGRRPGSCVKHLRWLLVILLIGQASCNQTSAAPPTTPATTDTQISVYYFVDITVDVKGKERDETEIKAWLVQVFQTNLESCISPNNESTTAPPTSTHTTNDTTLMTTATTIQSYNTTTATTVLTSNDTTPASTSTTSNSNNTAPASTLTTFNSTNTTPASTSTTFNSNNTNPAAASTTLQTVSTTAAAISTTLQTVSTTAAAISTTLQTVSTTLQPSSTTSLLDPSVVTQAPGGGGPVQPTKKPNPSGNKQRIAREVHGNVTEASGSSNDNTTGLYQDLEVNCAMKTAIRNTTCNVMLKLRQSVPPCCVLRALCAASMTSSDIQVVGRKADRTSQLETECNSNPQEERTCFYNGPTGGSCEASGSAYVVQQSNSTHCGAGQVNNTCSCSAYCNGTDAYYSFQMYINNPEMNESYVLFLISKIQQTTNCSLSANGSCPLNIVASEYKEASLTCGLIETNVQSCMAILRFARQVPICAVSEALTNVFKPEKQISYSGLVTRAAICENSAASNNPLNSLFTWFEVNLTPAELCLANDDSHLLSCQNGKNLALLLDESCVHRPSTTSSPDITTAQPNTTLSVNVTSPPLNATTEALNKTTTVSANVTGTNSLNNTTLSPLNTTTEALNTNATTVSSNVTATTTLNNTTTTTANESVSFTTSESPTTTLSADSQANALLDLTRDVSNLNSSQVEQLVSQLEDLLSGPTVSLELGNTSVHIVSNLLDASPEVLATTSNRIIGIVDTVGLKLVLDQPAETILSEAVALSVKTADGTNFQGTVFSISDPSNVQVRGDPRLRRSVRTDSTIPQGSIRLPPSLTQDLTSEEQQQASRVQFNFYQRSTVFQDRSLGQRRLNSGILGASVANLSITGLQDDVIINLRNTEPIPANFVATCVFWDFTLNDGSGGWSSSGCFVRNSTDNETVCSCNHLTSFAILLDLSREPLTSRVQATILTFITYIGCGISAIFLSVTLLTYLAFGKLRKDIPSKILIQLCLALLMLNLVFLVDAWLALYPEAEGLCISTAWFLHYFLLATFTWMGLEAVHMYLALVKVFNSYISRYMLKFSLVGWGVPMIVVIIVIAIDKDNYGLVSYGRFTDGTSDDFCWLKNDIAFYVAVVAYFCIIFLFNFVMFIVVLIQLCRIKRQNPHNSVHRSTLQDARSVAGITLLLGLTWGFAFFAWGPVNLAFMYLFAIFNSLQGFFIFVFHCAVKENVRRQWRTYLCCGKMRLAENSEWSRTATQKTTKKGSVTRLTSLNSSKSNNSSSSSSFLVSESSEQINGIGSPFDDRAITADEEPRSDVVLNEINRQYRNQQAP